MKKTFPPIHSVEEFVAMHPEVCSELTEKEQSVVAKTAISILLAYNQSEKKGLAYATNLTPTQRRALGKFITVAQRVGKTDNHILVAARNLGIL